MLRVSFISSSLLLLSASVAFANPFLGPDDVPLKAPVAASTPRDSIPLIPTGAPLNVLPAPHLPSPAGNNPYMTPLLNNAPKNDHTKEIKLLGKSGGNVALRYNSQLIVVQDGSMLDGCKVQYPVVTCTDFQNTTRVLNPVVSRTAPAPVPTPTPIPERLIPSLTPEKLPLSTHASVPAKLDRIEITLLDSTRPLYPTRNPSFSTTALSVPAWFHAPGVIYDSSYGQVAVGYSSNDFLAIKLPSTTSLGNLNGYVKDSVRIEDSTYYLLTGVRYHILK